jgi:hypothetical protein
VSPAQRRYVLEQVIRNLAMHFAQVGDGPFDIDRVPVYDRADDEVGRLSRSTGYVLSGAPSPTWETTHGLGDFLASVWLGSQQRGASASERLRPISASVAPASRKRIEPVQ